MTRSTIGKDATRTAATISLATLLTLAISNVCYSGALDPGALIPPSESYDYYGSLRVSAGKEVKLFDIPFDYKTYFNGEIDAHGNVIYTENVAGVTHKAHANYEASASISAEGHRLKVSAEGKADFTGSVFGFYETLITYSHAPLYGVSAEANLYMRNGIYLQYTGEGEAPDVLGSGVDLHYRVDGEASAVLTTTPYNSTSWGSQASGSVSIGAKIYEFKTGENSVFGEWLNGSSFTVGAVHKERVVLDTVYDPDRSAIVRGNVFFLNFNLSGSSTLGTFLNLWDHTVELTAVTFPDGSTPESHGFEVYFGNGLPSPNLQIPEPTSALLAGLALSLTPRRRGLQQGD